MILVRRGTFRSLGYARPGPPARARPPVQIDLSCGCRCVYAGLGRLRGTLAPMANADFKAAARRHHHDALFLLGDKRWANADHLAGIAAECALKAIMTFAPFGAAPNTKGFLEWGQPPARLTQHIKDLWSELELNVGGYSAPAFSAMLTGSAPFSGWDVSDRYSDGAAVTQQKASAHLGAAAQVLAVLQQVELAGYVS